MLRKVGTLLITLFFASLIVFFSRFVLPGDPARFLLRGRSPKPEAALAEITKQFGLDKPPIEHMSRGSEASSTVTGAAR